MGQHLRLLCLRRLPPQHRHQRLRRAEPAHPRSVPPGFRSELIFNPQGVTMRSQTRRWVALLCALVSLFVLPARAAEGVSETVITAALKGRTISALVSHWREHDAFARAVLLMPGSPGIMKIQSADAYGMKGNFLIRSRQVWLDRETLVLSVDAPSDEWSNFTGRFRESERYAQDIKGLILALRQQYGPLPLTIVGTSEGSVSAYYAAKAVREPQTKVIFSASLFHSTKNSHGLSTLDFDDFKFPTLWVHHADDPCRFTLYRDAQQHAEKTHTPLLTVRSSNAGRGDACQAFTQHGFVGIENETVRAMKAWVVQGVVGDVTLP